MQVEREDWEENFSEWYNNIIKEADLIDKRYPIKGMSIWRPYGFKIMKQIEESIHDEVGMKNYEEVLFPLLIPENQFEKEAEHIKGFEDEIFWVTKAGNNELDQKLALRPTSETAMYSTFDLWVRSHTDLPLRTYQIVNMFRYETKHTRPLIRVREVSRFFEGHTCHKTYEKAEKQIEDNKEIMKNLADDWALPYLELRRPPWDKFPGADYSLGVDVLMPNGRTLQVGTIHQYKQNFAKAYDITFEDVDGEHKYVHQTTYGMSERLLAAIISLHGDDNGLVLPPTVAHHQVVIVPILFEDTKEEVLEEANKIKTSLESKGIRVNLDDSDERPGSKFFHWEKKGVPLRIEIGPRDIEENKAVLVRRDTMEKEEVSLDEIEVKVEEYFGKIMMKLKERSEKILEEKTVKTSELKEVEKLIDDGNIVKLSWCGEEECGLEMEEKTDSDMLGIIENEEAHGKCDGCGKEAKHKVYFAKTF